MQARIIRLPIDTSFIARGLRVAQPIIFLAQLSMPYPGIPKSRDKALF